MKNFLPLMDDLQRALEAIEKSNDLEALREGVKLIAQKFRETLKKQNVKEIEALGLELDTDHHEAVAVSMPGRRRRARSSMWYSRLQDGRQGVAFCESGRRRVTGVFV